MSDDNVSDFGNDIEDEPADVPDPDEEPKGKASTFTDPNEPFDDTKSVETDFEDVEEDEVGADSNDELLEGEEEEEPEEINVATISSHSKVNRVIDANKRKFSNILSRYEMTELISIRATQISEHNDCLIDTGDVDDPIIKAKMEFMAKKSPLFVIREAGDKYNPETKQMETWVEHWYPNEMQPAEVYKF